ncbi:MAG: methyl-accepting chemotaxis protein [Sporomusaceae bacterium]|nr:methyl-accepting chemotaxis protein [Sporomusaceae bacterium]
MKFVNNLPVSLKLSILICIGLVSLLVVTYTGYYFLQRSSSDVGIMYRDRLKPVELVNQTFSLVALSNASTLELMVTTDEKRNQEIKKDMTERSAQIGKNLEIVEKSLSEPEGKALMAKVQASRQKYRDIREKALVLARANKNTEAYAVYVQEVYPQAQEYFSNLNQLSAYYSTLSNKMDEDNKAALTHSVLVAVGVMAVAGLLLLGSGFYITRNITVPLSLMVRACQDLANGDFREKPRRVLRSDEVGKLADALVLMRSSLNRLMRQVGSSAEHLAASAEELTASADQSSQASQVVANSITDVAQGMAQQLSAAGAATEIIESMSDRIKEASGNTNRVAQQSLQAADTAQGGAGTIEEAVAQMSHVESSVNGSALVVAQLGERSKEIGQIVEVIANIAGQTNLLALNAAIEAARAGEQGRGFAVVADEVRKLAEQSEEAAKQISALIQEIQGDTEKAVLSMDQGTKEVKRGAAVVQKAGVAFTEIVAGVTAVSEQVAGISHVIDQLAQNSNQIVGSVKEIDNLSKKAASETETVSAATEEQAASTGEISGASQSLAQLAVDLRNITEKFQV